MFLWSLFLEPFLSGIWGYSFGPQQADENVQVYDMVGSYPQTLHLDDKYGLFHQHVIQIWLQFSQNSSIYTSGNFVGI